MGLQLIDIFATSVQKNITKATKVVLSDGKQFS
jgi:hypothetical protein